MTKSEKATLRAEVEHAGLDYAVLISSDWDEIIDPDFHELRKDYIKSIEALERYIGISYL